MDWLLWGRPFRSHSTGPWHQATYFAPSHSAWRIAWSRMEAWRGVIPKLVLSDNKLQLGTNTRLQNLPLLGPFLAQLLGKPTRQSQQSSWRAGCALPQPPQAAFDQRMKTWQRWQDAQATLQKKREAEARLLWANKPDKLQQAKDEIVEVRPLRQPCRGILAPEWAWVPSPPDTRNTTAGQRADWLKRTRRSLSVRESRLPLRPGPCLFFPFHPDLPHWTLPEGCWLGLWKAPRWLDIPPWWELNSALGLPALLGIT